MKKHFIKGVLPLLLVLLSSCGAQTAAIGDYFDETIPFHEGFKVLQLTDLHWSVNTDVSVQTAYSTAVVKKVNPDFIMITGDCLLGTTVETAKSFVSMVESWDVPFGVSWGNHDRQGSYSPAWLSGLFANAKNSHYRELNDSVYGRSNYVISLIDPSTGKASWNIYAIDSNSYRENSSGIYYDYDVIHDDQIAWFNQAVDYSSKKNGKAIPGLAYFHIPLFQWSYAYLENQKGLMGEMLEKGTNSFPAAKLKEKFKAAGLDMKSYPGYKDSGFFDAGVKGNIRGFFCGHDHSDDWGTKYTDAAGTAYIGYGVKGSKELYYTHGSDTRGYMRDYDIIGGSLVTLHLDSTFDLTHYYVQMDAAYTTYTEEVKGL
jgi:hypothetical protein